MGERWATRYRNDNKAKKEERDVCFPQGLPIVVIGDHR